MCGDVLRGAPKEPRGSESFVAHFGEVHYPTRSHLRLAGDFGRRASSRTRDRNRMTLAQNAKMCARDAGICWVSRWRGERATKGGCLGWCTHTIAPGECDLFLLASKPVFDTRYGGSWVQISYGPPTYALHRTLTPGRSPHYLRGYGMVGHGRHPSL